MFKREITPLSEDMVRAIDQTISKLEFVEESVSFNGRTFKDYKTFKSEKDANDFLEKNDDHGVIGEKGGKVYVAKMKDMGEEVELDEAMDPVNPKALKKDFEDRKDKDIDNDGDTDSSDEYLHARRKAISKAMKKRKMDEGYRLKMVTKDGETMKSKVYPDKKSADSAHWDAIQKNKKQTPNRQYKSIEVVKESKNLNEKFSEVELDEGFKIGDKVKIKDNASKETMLGYKRELGKSGKVVKDYGDGDIKVNFGGNNDVSISSKDLVKESANLDESKTYKGETADDIRNGMPGFIGPDFAKKADDADIIKMAELMDELATMRNKMLPTVNEINKLRKKYKLKPNKV